MGDIHLNWLNWFHFLVFEGALFIVLIYCIIFLSPFLDAVRMSMWTVSFLVHLDSTSNFLQVDFFPLTYHLHGFKSRISRYLLSCVLSKQWIPIKKKIIVTKSSLTNISQIKSQGIFIKYNYIIKGWTWSNLWHFKVLKRGLF